MSGPNRLIALVVVSVLSAGAGCEPYYDDGYYDQSANEIVFGIHQRVDPTTGKNEVSAGYDYLGLAHKGGAVTNVFRDGDGDGSCYFERFDNRLGALRVESGVATWTGGALPDSGLQVLANAPERARITGDGWKADDVLTFEASGFAMPSLFPVQMYAPSLELGTIATTPAPAEGATDLALSPSDDLTVTWTPPTTGRPTHVMVAIDTDEDDSRGGGVRCFNRASAGSAVIPAQWIARLFSAVDPAKPIKGHVSVASHRQVTYVTRGDWTVYVVATTQHFEKAYAGSR